ncbi:histidine--tRNA ligase [Curtobacterium sp. Leaf261]|uniref:histidine--tRNA ligase n=1 Tax=Curtobacterium sp. Leaf261 TaxID=1736311 RepID=UPI0006FD837A|nr:ATP phosphoribosyltransferase regulatory subunit [Curtobacterium sp. Leaf261]KQO62814.1 histidine--tRNA ligase [Curtobacterium sp. Leaf261]
MATLVTAPRGMRDFLPAEKARREHTLGVIRGVYAHHGFDEIETPVVEDSSRLHAGLGGDNEKLAFAVMRRGITTEDLHAATAPLELADLGLRFDLTVPLARFYASHRAELPTVFRAVQIAPVWRAERPQKGRYRQFVQCDIDVLGEPGRLAEIELVQATGEALAALGVQGTFVRINDRRILTALLGTWGVSDADAPHALVIVDKLDKIGAAGVAGELVGLPSLTGRDAAGLQDTLTALATADWDSVTGAEWLDAAAFADLLSLREALPDVDLRFDPTLVRGMGYYTGTIFEVAHPDYAYSLGGGGRYDGMIGRFLGQDVPAVGFSLGFERLVDLVTIPDAQTTDAVALVFDRDVDPAVLATIKREVMVDHARVRLERRTKNMKNLLAGLVAGGYGSFASVSADTASATDLDFKPLT